MLWRVMFARKCNGNYHITSRLRYSSKPRNLEQSIRFVFRGGGQVLTTSDAKMWLVPLNRRILVFEDFDANENAKVQFSHFLYHFRTSYRTGNNPVILRRKLHLLFETRCKRPNL